MSNPYYFPQLFVKDNHLLAGVDVNIIANQGSDNDGVLRYNATTKRWELSNNGAAFSGIVTEDTPPPLLQVRKSSSTTVTTSYASVVFNNTDLEPTPAIISHDDTFQDRIVFGEAGQYMVTYSGSVEMNSSLVVGSTFSGRLRMNGSNTLSGSTAYAEVPVVNLTTGYVNSFSRTVIVNANPGDYMQLQVIRSGNSVSVLSDLSMVITRIGL